MPSTTQFSHWFQQRLKDRGWSQSDFARESGIPKSTVSTWFRGTRVPDPPLCEQIAEARAMIALWERAVFRGKQDAREELAFWRGVLAELEGDSGPEQDGKSR